ncbi:MAG: Fic family protein [Coriobacteriales bacterium]|nr:Fic family protein [Coriobacteriales bacterium]
MKTYSAFDNTDGGAILLGAEEDKNGILRIDYNKSSINRLKGNAMASYSDILRLWRGFKIQTEADLETHLNSFKVLFAYNSNKIENDNTTYEDTFQVFEHDRVSNYTGDVRTLTEIQNQKSAYIWMVKAVVSKQTITEGMVFELHRIITQGTYDERRVERGERPGEYKHHHYVVGINEVGAAPETVAEEIAELLDDIASTDVSTENVLTAAAYLHAKFENIHPFADGNGRTGRVLMNYFLMANNHPPLTVFDEDRTAYYRALDAFHTDQDIKPLREFIEQQVIKTWEKTWERTQQRKRSDHER